MQINTSPSRHNLAFSAELVVNRYSEHARLQHGCLTAEMSAPDSPPSTPLSGGVRHSDRPTFSQPTSALPDTPISSRKPTASGSRYHSATSSIDSSWFEVDSLGDDSVDRVDQSLGRLDIGAGAEPNLPRHGHRSSKAAATPPLNQEQLEPILL